jgi:hypothetical protein
MAAQVQHADLEEEGSMPRKAQAAPTLSGSDTMLMYDQNLRAICMQTE